MILAGDLGGTNARLALFEATDGGPRMVWRHDFVAHGADWLELVQRARSQAGAPELAAAVLAVAGPVEDGEAQLTNLGWHVSADALQQALGVPARLLNDLEAAAHGLLELAADDLASLQAGRERPGNRVLCSPGTGLGMGALAWDGAAYHAVPSEGGHQTMGALDEIDHALARHLAEQFGHASWERALSGPGLVTLYEFERGREEPRGLDPAGETSGSEGPALITERALRGEPRALRVMDRFCHLLGVAASNLALVFLARGGVYLGGGIPPRILSFLRRPAFLEGFLHKGRMRPLLEEFPVHVVTNPDCGILGAARRALEMARARA